MSQNSKTLDVLDEIYLERGEQDERFGTQDHEDGTDPKLYAPLARQARIAYAALAANGGPTWVSILTEEVMEAFAESDPVRLREELLQVAAVATCWVECLDRRGSK